MADILGFKIVLEGKEVVLTSYKEIEEAHKKELKALKEIKDTSSDTYKTQQKVVAELANEKQRLNDELKKEQKELKSVEDQAKKNIGAYALMSKELNTNRNRLKDLAAEGKEATDEFQDLEKQVLALDLRLKDIDFNVGQYQRNVGNYKSALQDYFGTGGIPAITEVANQFQGVGIAASLATGGAAAAAAAIAEVGTYVNETTKEFVNLRGAINDAFSGTDEQIDEYTVKTKALLDTFTEVDQSELINATAGLTNITGDYSESLALLGDGLLVNKGRQQEFIDQVSEYSAKLKDAGVTGEQSLLLISEAFRSGTFNDTGIDAFNEGVISLRERTPATVKAIEGIGISSKQLDDLISEKGLAKTLEIVAQKTKGFGRESKEMGAILADVFRGAGETAGFDFLQGINLAEGGLKDLIDTSDQATINMQELLNANTELATSQSDLAKEFGVASGNLEVLKVEAENFFLRLLVDAIKEIKEFLKPFQDLGRSFNALLNDLGFANTDFNIFNSLLKAGLFPLQKISEGIQTFVKGITLAVDKVRDFAHWTGVLNKTEKENTTAQNNSTKATKDEIKALKDEIKALKDKIKAREDETKATKDKTKATKDKTKAIADEKKEAALATTSLAYMKKELATLKQELETAPNQTAIESTILKINEAEAKIKAANEAVELFKRKLSEQEEGFNGDGGELESVGSVTEIQDDTKIEISQKTQDVITEMTKSAVDERTAYEIEQQKQISAAKEDIANKSFEAARGLSEALTAIQLRNAGDNEAKIKEIKEKAAKREKAIAITETLFNTYKAATAALATPPPFGQILAGVVTAIGLANVAKIASTPIQLAQGGIIGGSYLDSYSNDTQPALLSRGEAVIPASSVSANPTVVKSLISKDGNTSNALLEPVRDEMHALLVATNNRIDRITVISDPLAQITASLAQKEIIKNRSI